MHLIPIKAERVHSGSDLLQSLLTALDKSGESLKNQDVLVITSKAVAYSQGLLVKVRNSKLKTQNSKPETRSPTFRELIRQEADQVLEEGDMVLTVKNKVLIPNAEIDNSNTPQGQVILWPKDPFGAARDIRRSLMEKFRISHFGIVISDSHCQPLRMGTSGIAIGWAGFEGVQDVRGSNDLFGRKMMYTKIAVADNLSSAANLEMGETDASVPYVLIRKAKVIFSDKEFSEEDYFISPSECLYRGLYDQKFTADTKSF